MDYKKTTAPGSTITRDVTDFSQGENIYEVLNVLSNILLLLSILHLAIADLLWITYIYVSMDKIKINHQ